MLLLEIEEQVKPLTRKEKWQLIRDVQEMLMQEEETDDDRIVRKLFTPGGEFPLFTPVGLEEGAATMQRYIDEGKL